MTAEQFSVEFDILYNNISSNKAPGLSQYEKSDLLTQAQELVVKDLYSGASGTYEKTEEITEYLRTITKQADFVYDTNADEADSGLSIAKIKEDEWQVKIPDDLWFAVYEQAILEDSNCNSNVVAQVVPVSHNDFYKTSDSPFRGANRRRVLRLTIGDNYELFTSRSYPLISYTCRYLSKPSNILLPGMTAGTDCPTEFIDDNSYDSLTGISSKLPESLHRVILMKAVQLAKAIWN